MRQKNIPYLWKKSPPLSQQPPSKNGNPVKPPLFENLLEGSTPRPSRKGREVHTNIHAKECTAHSGASRVTHPSNHLYYIQWIIHWYQKFTFHNAFSFLQIIHLLKPYLLTRCSKTRFFLWNRNSTYRNDVNK